MRVYQFRHIRADGQCSGGPVAPIKHGVEQFSWRLRVLVVVYNGTFFLFLCGPLVILLGKALADNTRVGVYMTVVGFGSYHLVHRIFGVVAAHETKAEPWPYASRRGDPVVGMGYASAMVLLIGGLFTALAGDRLGAYFLLAGFGMQIGVDLLLGALSYRDAMSRPWPNVAPREDEDDDW